MDTTAVVTVALLHLVFGGIVGALISNVMFSILSDKLYKQLDNAIEDMFDKDLELDHLAEEVNKLTNELKELRSKFPNVEVSEDDNAYLSDSSTEPDNKD